LVPDELVAQDYGCTAEIFTGDYRERLLTHHGATPQALQTLRDALTLNPCRATRSSDILFNLE
jgi:hypothetical protein